VLRRYRHGGLLGPLTGALFFGPQRALRELRVTARAEVSGAPVPHVLCLVLWPVFGPLWSGVIGTSEVRPARDLLDALRAADQPRARRSLVRKTGAAIRKLHDAGVEHRDLQLRNILVTAEADPRIVVLDLDRAKFHRYGLVPVASRARNLGRLARSAVKAGLWGTLIGRREVAAFIGAYTRGNRALRRELRAHAALERAKLALHRISYPFR
jgi:3-deoxy-D-manno-octulosonic acid kinase